MVNGGKRVEVNYKSVTAIKETVKHLKNNFYMTKKANQMTYKLCIVFTSGKQVSYLLNGRQSSAFSMNRL